MEIPELFHYTDKAGLVGMAQQKTMRLTNVRFMNDPGEFTYGLDLVKNYIKDNYHEKLGHYLNDIGLKYETIPALFSFSLSENRDLLSQWRGYCYNGGYSIKFDRNLLESFINRNKLEIGCCLYDSSRIEEFIQKKIVGMSPKDYKRSVDSGFYNKGAERMPFDLVGNVFHRIPFIKHMAYSEEKEWRIIFRKHHEAPLESLGDVIKYRKCKDELIPYIEFSLNDNFITHTMLSPGIKDLKLIDEVQALICGGEITCSAIPYRT